MSIELILRGKRLKTTFETHRTHKGVDLLDHSNILEKRDDSLSMRFFCLNLRSIYLFETLSRNVQLFPFHIFLHTQPDELAVTRGNKG